MSVERYSSLWHTALDFHENYERWYYGPFLGLDTETIQTQVKLTCYFLRRHIYVFKDIISLNEAGVDYVNEKSMPNNKFYLM